MQVPEAIRITPASPGDLEEALQLLERAELPTAGVADHFAHFLVARQGGHLVGTAGLELYQDAALLRSVAVAAPQRRQGLGLALTQAALDYARSQGARMAYLLTQTAADFFARKFGFAALPRDAVDSRLGASAEFQGACPDTAVAMLRPLADRAVLPLSDRVRWALAGQARQVIADQQLVPAAVLLLLYEKDGAPHVLLTRRTSLVEDHKGEVSFPGGAWHSGEDPSLLATALRESHEEVGVAPDNVEVLGWLDDTTPRSKYIITPYVGMLRERQAFQPAAAEVAEVLEVPLAYLQERARHRDAATEPRVYAGKPVNGEYVEFGDSVIWGATYRILRQFLELLNGER